MRLLITGILCLILIPCCYYDSQESLYPQVNTTCDTTNITFSKSITGILSSNCLSCHSNSQSGSIGGNIRLENYADVKTYALNGHLYGAVAHLSGYSPMPKGGAMLDNCSITIIHKWITSGAPDN